jgi:hypothetical protein
VGSNILGVGVSSACRQAGRLALKIESFLERVKEKRVKLLVDCIKERNLTSLSLLLSNPIQEHPFQEVRSAIGGRSR